MSKKKSRATVKSSRPWWIPVGVLFVLTLAAYWNSFSVPLVFDDLLTIQRNAAARFGEFSWNFMSPRALLYLTYTFNYVWSNQQVWSYHLINFLLHFLNGLLVFVVAERVFRSTNILMEQGRAYAALAAAFFLFHPVQTESVTYVSSRSELLSTLFYLGGFLVFVLWPTARIGFLCCLSVAVFYFFGLGSKEPAITLPAAIFLYDFLFLSKARFRPIVSRWRFYLPFLLGGGGVIYFLLTRGLRGTIGQGDLSSWQYFLTQCHVIVRYVQLVFVPIPIGPIGLNLDYHFRTSTSPLEPAVIASALFLCGLIFLGWTHRRRGPVFAFSILWFFITLSPTSSFVPVLDVIFEHRLYLPLVGVCMSFPFFIDWAYRKARERFAVPGTAFAYSCLVLAIFIICTIQRNYVWGDEVRLWTDVVSKSPRKLRPYNALAFAYYKRGDYEQAINTIQKGLEMLPDKRMDLADTLGNLYLKTRRFDEAVDLFKETTKSFSGDRLAIAYNNLGVAYMYKWDDLQVKRSQMPQGQFVMQREQILKPAGEAFLKALEIDPNMPWALDSFVNVESYRGVGSEVETKAMEQLKQKDDFNSLYTIGKVAFNSGDYAKADQYFERAEKLRDDAKIVFFNHGYALETLKQDPRAAEKYLQAIRLDPIFIEAHHNLGQIYMRQNEYSKAILAFEEVLRQMPKHVSTNLNLATIYMSQGNKELARSHLAIVLEASPGDQRATLMLQQLGTRVQ